MPRSVHAYRCTKCGERLEVVDALPYGVTLWCPSGDGRVFKTYHELDAHPEVEALTPIFP